MTLRVPRNPCLWKRKCRKRQLLAHGDYSNVSDCRTEFLAIFRGIFIIFFAVFENSYVFIPLFLNSYLCSVQPEGSA